MSENSLDIHSLLKANQTLSQATQRIDLLAEIVRILLANVGAERAAILCRDAGNWFIEACGQAHDPLIQTGMHLPLSETAPLPLSVVNAVIHSGKTLSLANVPQDAQFGSDTYLREHNVKSLLCLPVWHKDELILILYLENTLTEGVFTGSRLEFLQLLSDQMAISLENALVVESLKTSLAEREQMERALRQSEEQLRLVMDNMADVISQTDPYLNVVFTTPSLERVFGYAPAEIVGKPAGNWVHPDDLKPMLQKAAEARQRHDPFVFLEYRWRRADGEYLWIESATRLLYDDQWQSRGAIFASRDITERKRVEAELAAKRDTEQQFSERLATLVVVTNELSKAPTLDDLCRRAVEAGRQQLGYDRVALFFVTEDYSTMSGMYGTDNDGQTTDERHERHAIVEPSGLYSVVSGAVPFRFYKNAPVYRGDGQQVGFGDRIAVGLWNGKTVIGFLSVDNFIHRRPFTDQDCELMRLYASALGHLCTLKRAQDDLAQLAATLEQRVIELTEERFRNIFENSPIGIYQTTPDGRFLTANPAFIRMLGYTTFAELAQQDLNSSDYFPDYARDTFRQRLECEGRIIGLEATWTRKDGTRMIVRESARTVCDADGDVLYYEGTAEDITAWVQAEKERERLLVEVQEQAQRIQRIIDTVPDGVLVLDDHNRVILINPAGQQDLQVLTDVHEGDVLESLGGYPLSEFLTWSEERLWREIEANEQTFEVIVRPILVDSAAPHWLLVVRDVTQQRKIEEHASRQQQLAVVGQMAAGIAHDFNNILAVIMLYSQMALRTSDLSEKLRERLTIVYQQGQRASELINQILDFSRSTPLDLRPLDLAPLLKELDKLWQRALPENIRIHIVDDPEASYVVNADPTRIRQMLMNLAVNARDAMPNGGELSVHLEHIHFRAGEALLLPELHAGEWVRVSVSDTGNGIPDDVLPHIYEPFFTTKSPDQGTGLGLAQVFGIVALHKGAIDVKTKVDEGTTFLVYLPALTVLKRLESPGASDELLMGHQEIILVIEDNPQVRATLVDSLAQLNYRVIEASQGKEALLLCERYKNEIALVLSDWVMPEMGGRDLVRALRARGLSVRVIVLSGHPLDPIADELQESGIVWLQKPLNLEQLSRNVAEVLSSRPLSSTELRTTV